jgi:bifunctional ADP-heptose synthase (sugar kinase/adenylyltransferase)
MKVERLKEILEQFPKQRILVIGDFFLDKYFFLDPDLTEVSLETNLDAYQVVDIRCSPGAAGTVTSNLRAMETQVTALGVIGDDGEGYDLRHRLEETGVDISGLVVHRGRRTPSYAKPMMGQKDGSLQELNRLDTKNRTPLPKDAERRLMEALKEWLPHVDAVVAADQVQEEECGIITSAIREEMARLAEQYPEKILAADSRERIGRFKKLIVKPNVREMVGALQSSGDETVQDLAERMSHSISEEGSYHLEDWIPCGRWFYRRTGKPLFLTMGAQGILAFDSQGHTHQPGIRVTGPIDIVGAGDATMSGIIAALCSGATVPEAALVGCLSSSVTIRQIGTTGTASRNQILQTWLDQREGTV